MMSGEPHNRLEAATNARVRQLLLVGVGGAAGSLIRHGIVSTSLSLTVSVIVLNTIGSLAIGVLTGWLQHSARLQHETGHGRRSQWSSLLGVGFCGGLTTFSTHVVDVAQRLGSSSPISAAASLVGTTVLAVTAAAAGYEVARRWFEPNKRLTIGPGQ